MSDEEKAPEIIPSKKESKKNEKQQKSTPQISHTPDNKDLEDDEYYDEEEE
jgi:hypothetical protein